MTNFTQARVLCWLIFFWSSMYEYFLNDSTNHSNKSCPSLVCFMHIRNGSLAQSATPHHRTLVNVIVCVLRQLHQLFCTRAAWLRLLCCSKPRVRMRTPDAVDALAGRFLEAREKREERLSLSFVPALALCSLVRSPAAAAPSCCCPVTLLPRM